MPFKFPRFASKCTPNHTPKKYNTAGMIAALTISMYGMPTNSAIKNAAAPITGGINCPPVDAAASTAPAKSLW